MIRSSIAYAESAEKARLDPRPPARPRRGLPRAGRRGAGARRAQGRAQKLKPLLAAGSRRAREATRAAAARRAAPAAAALRRRRHRDAARTPRGVPRPRGAERTRPRGRWLTARITTRVRLRATPAAGACIAAAAPRTEFGSREGGQRAAPARRLAAGDRAERPNGQPGVDPGRGARLGAVDVSLHVDRSRAPAGRHARLARDPPPAGRRRPARHGDPDAAASRSPTSCARAGRTRPTAAARSRSPATRRSCCPAGPAATAWRSTRRHTRRRSARPPRSAACAPRPPTCRRSCGSCRSARRCSSAG